MDVKKIIAAVLAVVAALGGLWVALTGGETESTSVPAETLVAPAPEVAPAPAPEVVPAPTEPGTSEVELDSAAAAPAVPPQAP